jgi:hypothetical protein
MNAALSDGEDLLLPVRQAARRGRLREAEALALRASEELGQGNPAAAALANLRGGIAFEMGELERAESWFEQAMWLAGEHEDPLLAARATTNLGNVAHLRGKVVLAGSLYQGALEVYRRENDLTGVARSEHNLGMVERELGNLDGAAAHAANAVSSASLTGDDSLIGLTLQGQAETALRRGETDQARQLLAAARSVAERTEDALGLAEAARLESMLAYSAGRYVAALNGAATAYQAALRLGARYLAGECALLAAQVCRRLARRRVSDRFRRRAEDLFTTVGAVTALQRVEHLLG